MTTQSLNPWLAIQTPENPFPGLRPFEFHESDLFFGRDGQSEKLIAKLAAARFVAVVGTSGSGKSSLVRAGVVPSLVGGFTPDIGSKWRVALLRPGNEPIANLARALNVPDVFGSEDSENAALQVAITEVALRRGSRGLVEAVRQHNLPATENLLIVVDQFEELFRFARDRKSEAFANEAAAFVKLLLEARAQREVNIYVALTMRSDFLGDCAQFLDLPEAINESQYLIPRLTRDQLREAITGPVFVAGGEIAQPLVNRLLNDIGDDQDQLPILQHALMRTWDEWRRKKHPHELDQGPADARPADRMNLCCYEAVGGWTRTLSNHADEAYGELTPGQQLIAERMFKLLTEKDRDNRAIRRLTKLGEICAVTQATPAEVEAVIDTFRKDGRSFLLAPGERPLTEEALIDISHESLIRNWKGDEKAPRLSEWVEAETASANEYRRLAETAERYRQGRESLLSGNGLQNALDWQMKQAPTPEWAQRYYGPFDETKQRHFGDYQMVKDFLTESQQAHAAAVVKAEEERQAKLERDRRELNRARGFAAILTVLLLLALVSAGYAFKLRDEAQQQGQLAEKKSGEAHVSATQATEQAEIAKQKTIEAEASATKAAEQAKLAEEQKEKALTAEAEAKKQAQLAQQQKKNAEDATFEKAQEAIKAFEAKVRAEKAEQDSRGLYYLASLSLARNEFENGNRPRGYEIMDTFLEKPNDNLREFYWYHLWHENHQERATLKGQGDSVLSVAFAPDGRTLASASADGTVKLWDMASGQERATLQGHRDRVLSVALAPDGRTLASASADGTVKLWDVVSGGERATLLGHGREVVSVAFAPDGRTLASASGDSTVKLWDMASGQERATLRGHKNGIGSVVFAPDGRTLASASLDRTVRLWNVASGQGWIALKNDDANVLSVAFAPNGRTLASASADGTVKLWDVVSGKEQATLQGHEHEAVSIAFAPNGKVLASASLDKTVKLWDVVSGQERKTLKGHSASVWSVVFAPDGRTLASASADGTVKLWDAASEQEQVILQGHDREVVSLAFAPDGRTLASASGDSTVKLWDMASGQERATLRGHSNNVVSVIFSPNGETLASASWDNTVKLWDVASGQERATLLGHSDSIASVVFAPDGRTLASASWDRTVKLWDVASGQERATLRGHTERVMSVAFAPDGRTLASASLDRTVKLWDVASRQERLMLKGHHDGVMSVVFAPNGRTLASASADRTVKLWDVAGGQERATLQGHSSNVWSVAFTPNGRTLASASTDRTVKLWDVDNGQERATLKGHSTGVWSVIFALDGQTLASGGFDGTVRLYRGATEQDVVRQRNH